MTEMTNYEKAMVWVGSQRISISDGAHAQVTATLAVVDALKELNDTLMWIKTNGGF